MTNKFSFFNVAPGIQLLKSQSNLAAPLVNQTMPQGSAGGMVGGTILSPSGGVPLCVTPTTGQGIGLNPIVPMRSNYQPGVIRPETIKMVHNLSISSSIYNSVQSLIGGQPYQQLVTVQQQIDIINFLSQPQQMQKLENSRGRAGSENEGWSIEDLRKIYGTVEPTAGNFSGVRKNDLVNLIIEAIKRWRK